MPRGVFRVLIALTALGSSCDHDFHRVCVSADHVISYHVQTDDPRFDGAKIAVSRYKVEVIFDDGSYVEYQFDRTADTSTP